MTDYRARLYRAVFAAAAAYHLSFGAWAFLRPQSFFSAFNLAEPRYPSIWACLGMVIGLYGAGYAYAATRLDRATPFIAIGLAGKLLGPVGWIGAVSSGEWPIRTITIIFFNDVIWWVPFGLFLLEGRKAAPAVRASAPYVCAALNAAAILAMAVVLRQGTEIVPVVADRLSYISDHPTLWRVGWGVWVAAAVSLVAFYAWWGSHVSARWGVAAFGVASVGLVCDLFAESLLIGWLPHDYDRIAPLTTLLTGAAANGLYTGAGVILTLAAGSLRGLLRAAAWMVWLAGAALTACTIGGSATGIAITTAALFAVFCPWIVVFGRTLQTPRPIVPA